MITFMIVKVLDDDFDGGGWLQWWQHWQRNNFMLNRPLASNNFGCWWWWCFKGYDEYGLSTQLPIYRHCKICQHHVLYMSLVLRRSITPKNHKTCGFVTCAAHSLCHIIPLFCETSINQQYLVWFLTVLFLTWILLLKTNTWGCAFYLWKL